MLAAKDRSPGLFLRFLTYLQLLYKLIMRGFTH